MKQHIIPLILLISVTVTVTVNGNEDPLIRQVVPEEELTTDPLLNTDDHHFTLFKTKFKRTYKTQEEHDYRFTVFKANVRRAKRHQILDPTAQHGVTKFSDLTPAEFKRTYLGLNAGGKGSNKLKLPADANKAPILPTNGLPEEFDWREKGAVTPVKNQDELDHGVHSCWVWIAGTAFEVQGTRLYWLSSRNSHGRKHLGGRRDTTSFAVVTMLVGWTPWFRPLSLQTPRKILNLV
ncbi:cysteine proteinase 15A-like protein [Tanacetum coccineum]|uniref:Cysteine proteinase 15A-like protein n=1 Tax=Tanacetum coccineum TaxID=301880 RepID=A0ABQ5DS06_9ASTR